MEKPEVLLLDLAAPPQPGLQRSLETGVSCMFPAIHRGLTCTLDSTGQLQGMLWVTVPRTVLAGSFEILQDQNEPIS